jgi:hypothetical protein
LTRPQERPRLNSTSGQRNSSNRGDFNVVHGLRPIPPPYNSYNTWSY